MRDFASEQEQQKCEAKKKGEDDRRIGEQMRRAAMMSMFQYLHFKYTIFLMSQFYRHAGRSSTPTTSPTTSSVDLDDDEADEDANGSSSKKMKLSQGITMFVVRSMYLVKFILCLGKRRLSTAELLHEKFQSKAAMKEKELEVKKMELEIQQNKWRRTEEETGIGHREDEV